MDDGRRELGIDGVVDAEEVGRGGFAVVYRAQQPAFDRTVAVKVLDARPDETALARFQREIRAMGTLSEHTAIATVLDAGTTGDGRPYLLLPFFSGGSLQDALEEGRRFTVEEATRIGMALGDALEAAHAEGLPTQLAVARTELRGLDERHAALLERAQRAEAWVATKKHQEE